MNRFFSIAFTFALTITSASSFAYLPIIELPNGQVSVDKLCFDNGYIREKNSRDLSNIVPVHAKTILKFENGTEFVKNDFIPRIHNFYNRHSQKFENYEISKCQINLLLSLSPESEVIKEANSVETIFYGNLKNYGVNDTALENWKKWENMSRFLRYNAEKDRVSLVSDFSKISRDYEISDFNSWSDLSGKVIGGEQSGGGGAGRVRINMNMSASDISRFRPEQGVLERILGMESFISKILYENKKVSKSRIYVTIPKK
ncbi:hypothetical protein [Halobacteriovorax marinus]|nr:hypothetical protein [Halobacteriovorax marinus]